MYTLRIITCGGLIFEITSKFAFFCRKSKREICPIRRCILIDVFQTEFKNISPFHLIESDQHRQITKKAIIVNKLK